MRYNKWFSYRFKEFLNRLIRIPNKSELSRVAGTHITDVVKLTGEEGYGVMADTLETGKTIAEEQAVTVGYHQIKPNNLYHIKIVGVSHGHLKYHVSLPSYEQIIDFLKNLIKMMTTHIFQAANGNPIMWNWPDFSYISESQKRRLIQAIRKANEAHKEFLKKYNRNLRKQRKQSKKVIDSKE